MKKNLFFSVLIASTLIFPKAKAEGLNSEDFTNSVSALSVSGTNMGTGQKGNISISVWTGDCQVSIGAQAEIKSVTSRINPNITGDAIVITIRPVVTDCALTNIAKLITAEANLDELARNSVKNLPQEKQKDLVQFLVLPQVNLSPVLL